MNFMKNFFTKFLFYLLLYLRPFFRFAARLVGGFLFLSGLAFIFFNPQYWKLGILVTSMGFVLFLVREFYDGVIRKTCPEGMWVRLNIG